MTTPEPFGPYVHMGAADRILWRRWLDAGGAQYAPFVYDVRVGAGLQMPPGSTPLEQQIAYLETAKRIDAMSPAQSPPIIFEVKPRAGTTAIGQLIVYGHLWQLENPASPAPQLWLITDTLAPDIAPVAQSQDILVTQLGP